MDVDNVKLIITCHFDYAAEPLRTFLEKNSAVTAFPELDKNDMRQDLWIALFSHLENDAAIKVHSLCLSALRILSRDKTNLNELIKEKWMNTLRIRAHLNEQNKIVNYDIPVEALKCLSNILFNSEVARAYSVKNGTVEGIIARLKTYRNVDIPYDVKMFDMRLLFVLTALCSEIRPKIKTELRGFSYLIDLLESIAKNDEKLSNKQYDLSSDVLKVLFNLSIRTDSTDEEEESNFLRLVSILRQLLLKETETPENKYEFYSHVINLLTTVPNNCLKELSVRASANLTKEMQFEELDMTPVSNILAFLKYRFSKMHVEGSYQELSPTLTVLLKCAMSNSNFRKYIRLQILPPLKDVHTRPEEGSELRNYLCRLLTRLEMNVRDLASELLFVLCKENVNRMIKYTGYGNAAGLFANRGLMGRTTNNDANSYSSDSENSDTEEYQQFKHGINPVLGCYEPPHPNPTEGMSEEQKEYEAMKLVNLMDSLARQGVVLPSRIGEDGRPEPVEHVLQLQRELPRQQVHQNQEPHEDDDE